MTTTVYKQRLVRNLRNAAAILVLGLSVLAIASAGTATAGTPAPAIATAGTAAVGSPALPGAVDTCDGLEFCGFTCDPGECWAESPGQCDQFVGCHWSNETCELGGDTKAVCDCTACPL